MNTASAQRVSQNSLESCNCIHEKKKGLKSQATLSCVAMVFTSDFVPDIKRSNSCLPLTTSYDQLSTHTRKMWCFESIYRV